MPRLRPAIRVLNSDAEHHQVLFELGLLDDMDDWPLFQKQEARYAVPPEDEKHWSAHLAGSD